MQNRRKPQEPFKSRLLGAAGRQTADPRISEEQQPKAPGEREKTVGCL